MRRKLAYELHLAAAALPQQPKQALPPSTRSPRPAKAEGAQLLLAAVRRGEGLR